MPFPKTAEALEELDMRREEKIRDDALAEGMDCEHMMVRAEIENLISSRNPYSSYGKGQIFILKKLLENITWRTASERN